MKNLFVFPGSERLMLDWYRIRGRNQQPHIKRVVADAQMICNRLDKEYTRELELASVLHDVAKDRTGYPGDHGEESARLAAEIIRGALFLDDDSCNRVLVAISDHNHQSTKPVSELSALLRAADAGKPSAGFYARKSVGWCLKQGWDLARAYKNAFERLRSGEFIPGEGGSKCAIDEYSRAFAREIEIARIDAANLSSPEDIPQLIAAYNASPDCEDPEA